MLNSEKLDAIFNVFDADGDGYISMDELKSVFQGQLSGHETQSGVTGQDDEKWLLIDDADTGGLDLSTQKEEDIWKSIMAAADEDKDGKISKQEFEMAMTKVLQH